MCVVRLGGCPIFQKMIIKYLVSGTQVTQVECYLVTPLTLQDQIQIILSAKIFVISHLFEVSTEEEVHSFIIF